MLAEKWATADVETAELIEQDVCTTYNFNYPEIYYESLMTHEASSIRIGTL